MLVLQRQNVSFTLIHNFSKLRTLHSTLGFQLWSSMLFHVLCMARWSDHMHEVLDKLASRQSASTREWMNVSVSHKCKRVKTYRKGAEKASSTRSIKVRSQQQEIYDINVQQWHYFIPPWSAKSDTSVKLFIEQWWWNAIPLTYCTSP